MRVIITVGRADLKHTEGSEASCESCTDITLKNLCFGKGKMFNAVMVKGKDVPMLFFNWAPPHEGVLGSGGS
jgi:hypothetical protein